MRGSSHPMPWAEIGSFMSGAIALLFFFTALGDPTLCATGCRGFNLLDLLLPLIYRCFGRWGIRLTFLFIAGLCFYLPFASADHRELRD